MSDLESAQMRLEAAIARLGSALAGGRGDAAGAVAEFNRLKAEHAALKDTTGRVARRLDAAIAKLSGILGEGAGAE